MSICDHESEHGRVSVARLLALGVFSILILLMLVVGIWWSSFTDSPSYSLTLLVDAAQRNDAAEFDKYFDTTQVLNNFISDVAKRTTNSAGLVTSLTGQTAAFTSSIRDHAKPLIRQRIRQKVESFGAASSAPLFLKALAIRAKSETKEEGDQATVTISDKNRSFEAKLRKTGDGWQVIAVKDDELAMQVVNDLMQSVPKDNSLIPKIVIDQFRAVPTP